MYNATDMVDQIANELNKQDTKTLLEVQRLLFVEPLLVDIHSHGTNYDPMNRIFAEMGYGPVSNLLKVYNFMFKKNITDEEVDYNK